MPSAEFQAIDRASIATAEKLIRPHIRRTPIICVEPADFGLAGEPLTLKLELFQHTGSFKPRGAFTNLLTHDIPPAGVAAASGGNHGAAVAYAAQQLGLKATIFVPSISPPAKVERIRSYGADLHVGGALYPEALATCVAFCETNGALAVHAYDQPETLIGQGTVGLEIEADAPDLDTLLVAVGGGGLIGGIAAWFGGGAAAREDRRRRTRNSADPPHGARGWKARRCAGRRHRGGFARAEARRRTDVSDRARACRARRAGHRRSRSARRSAALWEKLRIVAEPGGAAAFAALLSRRYVPEAGERVGIVICGGNTGAVDFSR